MQNRRIVSGHSYREGRGGNPNANRVAMFLTLGVTAASLYGFLEYADPVNSPLDIVFRTEEPVESPAPNMDTGLLQEPAFDVTDQAGRLVLSYAGVPHPHTSIDRSAIG